MTFNYFLGYLSFANWRFFKLITWILPEFYLDPDLFLCFLSFFKIPVFVLVACLSFRQTNAETQSRNTRF